ncbi:hypothetical protein ABT317_10575, partial [Streptomyces carpinensis]
GSRPAGTGCCGGPAATVRGDDPVDVLVVENAVAYHPAHLKRSGALIGDGRGWNTCCLVR